ncbi:MAG TPA: hypothetical protein VNL18_16375 [Gemmatimonadales bacterium]|nr:hypothetical protein [Gemmatimonadales bacterium]
MASEDRREFLKRLAKTTAYVAPVVQSFAAPADVVAQGSSPSKKPMKAAAFEAEPAPSPWDAPAPGMRP